MHEMHTLEARLPEDDPDQFDMIWTVLENRGKCELKVSRTYYLIGPLGVYIVMAVTMTDVGITSWICVRVTVGVLRTDLVMTLSGGF
jgi:hypothetical protein